MIKIESFKADYSAWGISFVKEYRAVHIDLGRASYTFSWEG